MSEEVLKRQYLSILEPHFDVETEVPGRHFTGKKLYLDAVLTPKRADLWKNQNISLGIEFKDELRLQGGTKEYTKWLAQCIDYSHTKWEGFGYLFIFAAPGLIKGTHASWDKPGDMGWLLPRMMGQLGIGELRFVQWYGLTFFLQEAHRIWSVNKGVMSGKHWSLERKFGSR